MPSEEHQVMTLIFGSGTPIISWEDEPPASDAETLEASKHELGGIVSFKYEPMVLHITSSSPTASLPLLHAALSTGHQNSGTFTPDFTSSFPSLTPTHISNRSRPTRQCPLVSSPSDPNSHLFRTTLRPKTIQPSHPHLRHESGLSDRSKSSTIPTSSRQVCRSKNRSSSTSSHEDRVQITRAAFLFEFSVAAG